ncbi:hypothetical protein JW905_10970 [bacterium]|nr:hypothetical protein [candidate division CSSED10-310 bacterium]
MEHKIVKRSWVPKIELSALGFSAGPEPEPPVSRKTVWINRILLLISLLLILLSVYYLFKKAQYDEARMESEKKRHEYQVKLNKEIKQLQSHVDTKMTPEDEKVLEECRVMIISITATWNSLLYYYDSGMYMRAFQKYWNTVVNIRYVLDKLIRDGIIPSLCGFEPRLPGALESLTMDLIRIDMELLRMADRELKVLMNSIISDGRMWCEGESSFHGTRDPLKTPLEPPAQISLNPDGEQPVNRKEEDAVDYLLRKQEEVHDQDILLPPPEFPDMGIWYAAKAESKIQIIQIVQALVTLLLGFLQDHELCLIVTAVAASVITYLRLIARKIKKRLPRRKR